MADQATLYEDWGIVPPPPPAPIVDDWTTPALTVPPAASPLPTTPPHSPKPTPLAPPRFTPAKDADWGSGAASPTRDVPGMTTENGTGVGKWRESAVDASPLVVPSPSPATEARDEEFVKAVEREEGWRGPSVVALRVRSRGGSEVGETPTSGGGAEDWSVALASGGDWGAAPPSAAAQSQWDVGSNTSTIPPPAPVLPRPPPGPSHFRDALPRPAPPTTPTRPIQPAPQPIAQPRTSPTGQRIPLSPQGLAFQQAGGQNPYGPSGVPTYAPPFRPPPSRNPPPPSSSFHPPFTPSRPFQHEITSRGITARGGWATSPSPRPPSEDSAWNAPGYQVASPAPVVAPPASWATGRSAFSAKMKFAPPREERGYEGIEGVASGELVGEWTTGVGGDGWGEGPERMGQRGAVQQPSTQVAQQTHYSQPPPPQQEQQQFQPRPPQPYQQPSPPPLNLQTPPPPPQQLPQLPLQRPQQAPSQPPQVSRQPLPDRNRVTTGGQVRGKLTTDELEAKMSAMRIRNEEDRKKRERAVADESAYLDLVAADSVCAEAARVAQSAEAERVRQAELNRIKRNADHQASINAERERTAQAKLQKIQGREWDLAKTRTDELHYPSASYVPHDAPVVQGTRSADAVWDTVPDEESAEEPIASALAASWGDSPPLASTPKPASDGGGGRASSATSTSGSGGWGASVDARNASTSRGSGEGERRSVY